MGQGKCVGGDPAVWGRGPRLQLRGRGSPQEVLSRRKLDPLAPRQAHPGCRAESGLEGGERRSRSQAWSVTAVAGEVTVAGIGGVAADGEDLSAGCKF